MGAIRSAYELIVVGARGNNGLAVVRRQRIAARNGSTDKTRRLWRVTGGRSNVRVWPTLFGSVRQLADEVERPLRHLLPLDAEPGGLVAGCHDQTGDAIDQATNEQCQQRAPHRPEAAVAKARGSGHALATGVGPHATRWPERVKAAKPRVVRADSRG